MEELRAGFRIYHGQRKKGHTHVVICGYGPTGAILFIWGRMTTPYILREKESEFTLTLEPMAVEQPAYY